MVRWLNRAALFLPGALLLFCLRPVDTPLVLATLLAFTMGCLSLLLPGRWPGAALALFWAAVCFWVPAGVYFWALPVLDMLERRLRALPAAALLSLAALSGRLAAADLVAAGLLCGLAALLWGYGGRLQTLEAEVRRVRDEFTGVNLMLEEKNQALEQARDAAARLATLAERGRIAREIHDNVGHMLARSMMQTGAVMTLNRDPQTAEGLDALRQTLTLAMNSVRTSVHGLRDESLDLCEGVSAALRDFPGYETNLNYDMGDDVPAAVKACFSAVVREALANTAKHSSATRIEISLQEHPRFYQLRVRDNGSPQAAAPAGGPGMGLENMRLRAEALDGRFSVSRSGGFSLHITIPKQPDAGKEDAT